MTMKFKNPNGSYAEYQMPGESNELVRWDDPELNRCAKKALDDAMTIYLRQKAYREALKQRQEIRAARFKDASEKQRKAVPSTKTKLSRLVRKLKKEGRAR